MADITIDEISTELMKSLLKEIKIRSTPEERFGYRIEHYHSLYLTRTSRNQKEN